jgi:hypothetical protein
VRPDANLRTAPVLLHGTYGGTLHWATAKDGFDSILNLYNYYAYAFRDHSQSLTDAVAEVRFFNEMGEELAPWRRDVLTGETAHLSVSTVHPGFQGIVSARLTPNGKMPRLTATTARRGATIATSYFMIYRREGEFCDFSHELFLAQSRPQTMPEEWAQIVYLRPHMRAGVIVMNSRVGCKDRAASSAVTITLCDLGGKALDMSAAFDLPPGGSRCLMLDEALPQLRSLKQETVIVSVKSANIEQPMTLHLMASGDFNIHHF